MRTGVQLLLIAFACAIPCWLLARIMPPEPSIVSGVTIDWRTGRPVAHVPVLLDPGFNYLKASATSDARGHFTLTAPYPQCVYFVYANPRQHNTLMQMRFGQRVVLYRKGEQAENVAVPVIPETKLSGHVFGEGGTPIAGCNVAAITTTVQLPRGSSGAWDAAEEDDQQPFVDVDWVQTDSHGAYELTRLGADRYYVLARCTNDNQYGRALDRWSPMVYPQASSIAGGKELVLPPGDRVSGIDFHLHREKTHSLEGQVTLSDGSIPKPGVVYLHDLVALRSDRALSSTWLGHEDCDWAGDVRTFHCTFLSSGTYDLYFSLSPLDSAAVQVEKMTVSVSPTPTQRVLNVRLHNLPELKNPSQRDQTGVLDFRRVCELSVDGRPAIQVFSSSEKMTTGAACYYMTFYNQTGLKVPPGSYTVNAFESVFEPPRNPSGRAHLLRFERTFANSALRVSVQSGRVSYPTPHVLTRTEMIDGILNSLRR